MVDTDCGSRYQLWVTSVIYLRTSSGRSQRHVIKFNFNRSLFSIVSVFSLPSF